MLKQYRLKDYKFRLILWVVLLSSIGILVIGSAKESVQSRQIMGLVLGLIMMVIVSLIDYTWILNFYWLEYLFGLGLLVIVLFFGTTVDGATRWIDIGFTRFQPSDMMKIILIVFFARFFSDHEEQISKVWMILLSLVLIGIPVLLILKEPDLSTSIVCILLFSALIFVAGLKYKIVGGVILVLIPIIALIVLQPEAVLQGYQSERILGWLRPEEYPDISYQQTNSIVAIGSGQLYGKGLNNNVVSSVTNGNFIAAAQTDFIFAVAGEELGFLGCCMIVLLELLIAVECINIGRNARDLPGTLIGCGMGALIFFQSFINICVTTGLMPNTGLTLPFMSYGLTSLVSFCIGIGLVLNVGLQVRKY